MTYDEAMAKSRALDRALTESIEELQMPGMGAGKSVKQILADANAEVASALTEFAQSVAAKKRQMAEDIRANGALVVQKMDEDHRDTRDAFTEMLGNEITDTEDAAKNGGG